MFHKHLRTNSPFHIMVHLYHLYRTQITKFRTTLQQCVPIIKRLASEQTSIYLHRNRKCLGAISSFCMCSSSLAEYLPLPASTMECWHSVVAVMLDHIPSSGLRPLTPAIGMLAGNREALNHSIVITFEHIEKPGPRLIAISPKTQDGNKLWGLLSQDRVSSHTMHQLRTTPKKG